MYFLFRFVFCSFVIVLDGAVREGLLLFCVYLFFIAAHVVSILRVCIKGYFGNTMQKFDTRQVPPFVQFSLEKGEICLYVKSRNCGKAEKRGSSTVPPSHPTRRRSPGKGFDLDDVLLGRVAHAAARVQHNQETSDRTERGQVSISRMQAIARLVGQIYVS